MPKWLQGMVAPTLMLWLYAIASGIMMAVGSPKRGDLAAGVAFGFVTAWWVIADARKRGRQLCYDYDSFLYFLSPFLPLIYLFQTRGSRAFLTLLCCAGICLVGVLAGLVVTLIRGF
jgi:hypothetical protein